MLGLQPEYLVVVWWSRVMSRRQKIVGSEQLGNSLSFQQPIGHGHLRLPNINQNLLRSCLNVTSGFPSQTDPQVP